MLNRTIRVRQKWFLITQTHNRFTVLKRERERKEGGCICMYICINLGVNVMLSQWHASAARLRCQNWNTKSEFAGWLIICWMLLQRPTSPLAWHRACLFLDQHRDRVTLERVSSPLHSPRPREQWMRSPAHLNIVFRAENIARSKRKSYRWNEPNRSELEHVDPFDEDRWANESTRCLALSWSISSCGHCHWADESSCRRGKSSAFQCCRCLCQRDSLLNVHEHCAIDTSASADSSIHLENKQSKFVCQKRFEVHELSFPVLSSRLEKPRGICFTGSLTTEIFDPTLNCFSRLSFFDVTQSFVQ